MTNAQQRRANLLPNGMPKYVRCYDNGGVACGKCDGWGYLYDQSNVPANFLEQGQTHLCPKCGGTGDNPGGTLDRYTVVFTGHYRQKTGGQFWVLGMSGSPFHPQGIGMMGEYNTQIDLDKWGYAPSLGRHNHLGKRIEFSALPADCQRCVLDKYVYLWDLE